MGFKSCGKTTQGKLIGNYLKIPFFDLDHILINTHFKNGSIREFFYKVGEKEFRKLERALFLQLNTYPNGVYATGAGAFDQEIDCLKLNHFNLRIFIDTDYKVLLSRLKKDLTYPFLQHLEQLYEKRILQYEKVCTHKISVLNELPEEIFIKLIRTIEYGK